MSTISTENDSVLIDKLLSFEIWGDYAHFRRPYSTTSPLTYPIPTKTSIIGLMASILGRERDSYYEEFSPLNSRVGIQILSPVRKFSLGVNLVDTKKGFFLWDITENPRTQILFEILKDVYYRIYVWIKSDDIYASLKQNLESHTTIYTPYLGKAQFLANFKFVKEYIDGNIKKKRADLTKISTIASEDYGVMASSGHRRGRANMPMYMSIDRVASYQTIVYDLCSDYEPNTHKLTISRGEYYELDDDGELNIVLL